MCNCVLYSDYENSHRVFFSPPLSITSLHELLSSYTSSPSCSYALSFPSFFRKKSWCLLPKQQQQRSIQKQHDTTHINLWTLHFMNDNNKMHIEKVVTQLQTSMVSPQHWHIKCQVMWRAISLIKLWFFHDFMFPA